MMWKQFEHPATTFIACHDKVGTGRALLGIASARVEVKPYAKSRWFYVDEVTQVVGYTYEADE